MRENTTDGEHSFIQLDEQECEGSDVSGYSLYSKKQRNFVVKNELPEFYPPLPEKKYDIIYADPPWDYGGKMQYDKSCIKGENAGWRREIFISAANFKYPTIKTEQLKRIPIKNICSENCLLFLWVTNPHLAQGIELGSAWGFEYKTVAFIWDKMSHNPGQYTLSNCEMCLLFKKGKIPSPRGARNIQQLIRSPRREHSRKPDEVRENIVKMFPLQSRVELFARQKFQGWDSWGLETDNYELEQSQMLLFQ